MPPSETINGTSAAIMEAQNVMSEEAKNQADADSEVSQINTQQSSNDSNVQEYRSMSTSATPVSLVFAILGFVPKNTIV